MLSSIVVLLMYFCKVLSNTPSHNSWPKWRMVGSPMPSTSNRLSDSQYRFLKGRSADHILVLRVVYTVLLLFPLGKRFNSLANSLVKAFQDAASFIRESLKF